MDTGVSNSTESPLEVKPDKASILTLSTPVGIAAPPAPPEVNDQCVALSDQFPFPPTQYLMDANDVVVPKRKRRSRILFSY